MINQPSACIPYEHHYMLVRMAAALSGRITARSIAEHSFAHPGDPFGTILCEAWRVDKWTAVSAMASYMMALREECSNLQVTPPTFAEVHGSLYLAINTGRFPDVDTDALQRTLKHDVPKVLREPF